MSNRLRSKFLTYGCSIAVIVMVFLAIMEIVLRAVVIPTSRDGERIAAIYMAPETSVIIGDSHTVNGFLELPKGFVNLSKGGSNARMMNVFATEYFRFRKPKHVMIVAGPQVFSRIRIRATDENYGEYFGQRKFSPLYLFFFEPGVTRILGAPTKADRSAADYAKLFETWLFSDSDPSPIQTTVPALPAGNWSATEPERRKKLTRLRSIRQTAVNRLELREDFRTYSEMIRNLKQLDADVCLIRPPVTDEYLKFSAKNKRAALAMAAIRSLAEETKTKFVDFKDLNVQFGLEMFKNQDHLNEYGSYFYSRAVVRACFGN